ncbi:MAG: hypothetical protein JRE64_22795 [Deltaproteobacteria bacterium]|nr:hypothetical protein [Deltaproteobacteria bacterium]
MDSQKNIRIPKDLVFNFFISFAKFEFALKMAGFSKGNGKRVSPDWDVFAKATSFDKKTNKKLEEAVDYFMLNPPWKQVLIDGGMAWDSSMPNNGLSEIEKVLLLVRRVRNNLFHGGKFNIEVHEKKERTEKLLQSSLIILKACLALDEGIQNNFQQATI